jgi:hypothetical protein
MSKWYQKLNANQRALLIMSVLGVLVFLGLIPCFFNGMLAVPLGWIFGTLIEILAFLTIMLMVKNMMSNKESGPSTQLVSIFSSGLRLLLYASALVLSGLSTFYPQWLGGFTYLNFYATAAALVPMLFIVFITQFFASKHPEANIHESSSSEGEKR